MNDYIYMPEKNSRTACLEDFLSVQDIKHDKTQNDKNVIAKNQQEFGNRKRIKPWRTGTKSQQQIVPKGFKKGYRGVG